MIAGNSSSNRLDGDVGNNSVFGDSGNDTLIGGDGNDRLDGAAGDDLLYGGNGQDMLFGGEGNDQLFGGAGKDSLTGGSGRDVFRFDLLSETGRTTETSDVITDFKAGEDKINVLRIDADLSSTANDGFRFIGASLFDPNNATGLLRFVYDSDANIGYLIGSVDVDPDDDFVIGLAGISILNAKDIVL